MRISKLGEFGLIERFRKTIRTDASVVKGSGDDCAVIKFTRDKYLLFTCDMVVAGVDFNPREDPFLVGRKAIAVAASDIAACGGIPRYCLISLGLPQNKSLAFTDRLFKGMLNIARKYQINITGGDLSRARALTIDVSMLGVVEKKNLVLRSGAKEGDIIFVSGKLGGSISGRHLKFIPRIKEARFLTQHFKINAMIDISDGLAQDLGHILKESAVAAFLYEGLVPLSAAARNLADALYAGEDFELLFTLSRKEAKRLSAKAPRDFYPVGEIVRGRPRLVLVARDGRERVIPPKGFRHF